MSKMSDLFVELEELVVPYAQCGIPTHEIVNQLKESKSIPAGISVFDIERAANALKSEIEYYL